MTFLKVVIMCEPHALAGVWHSLSVADSLGEFLDAGDASFAVVTQRARMQRDGESIDDSIL
ncbi:MAG: hypothetical protein EBT94_12425, partial [Alphaproteobacteria bacterium]|nr:hypothetical protein [Alphaproteobacteria bacterium]